MTSEVKSKFEGKAFPPIASHFHHLRHFRCDVFNSSVGGRKHRGFQHGSCGALQRQPSQPNLYSGARVHTPHGQNLWRCVKIFAPISQSNSLTDGKRANGPTAHTPVPGWAASAADPALGKHGVSPPFPSHLAMSNSKRYLWRGAMQAQPQASLK